MDMALRRSTGRGGNLPDVTGDLHVNPSSHRPDLTILPIELPVTVVTLADG